MSGHHGHTWQLQNSTLLTQSLVPERNPHHSDHLGLCIVHILMALWACLANCSQIVNVALSPSLRHQPKNILVLNVCITDLIIGAFLCPLYSDSLMQGTWRHDVDTCIVYEVIFYAQVSISTLSVLVLIVERFYYLLTPRMMDGSGKNCVTTVLTALPWVIGSALVVPMFLNGARASFNEGTRSCQILWKKKFQAVTVFVSFFCPAFLVLSMTAAVVMLYVIFSVIAKRRDLGPYPDRFLMRDSLRVVLLSSFVCVFLQFPFFIVLLMEIFCQRDISNNYEPCGQSEYTWAVVAVITMLKPGLMPLTWLAYTDIRSGFQVRNWSLWSVRRRQARRQNSTENSDPCFNSTSRLHRTVASTAM
ncbi:unnamed protein product [Candidula unifasciata]|uniref:G-protein coupled receptors family 1 profile domain-containing protein n=1 Tax=Candidula unifasciata TaxID=100452 RepID=A0A8S3ZTI2_9EUPU|nr:unnamed protein product [Candidula unifasciata]